MKKICFVLPTKFSETKGGAELQAYIIASKLSKMDYEVHYICESKDKGTLSKDGINWHYLPVRERRFSINLLNYRKLRKYLDEIKPDVIYQRIRSVYTGLVAKYCQNNKAKMVWAVCSDEDVTKIFFAKRYINYLTSYTNWKISEYGIKRADKILVQSKQQKKLLHDNFGLKGRVIYNSIKVPEKPFIKRKPPIVLWIASIKKWKRPELFIRLASEFQDEKIEFVMVGRPHGGKYQDRLNREIKKVNNLKYWGEVPYDRVNELLEKGSIFVNTSLPREGFPNTFIQAWMREVPVVSLTFDPDDILEKKKIGFCSGNFLGLVKDVKKLINNDELRERMGNRARKHAIENYDINENIEEYVKLVEEIG